MSRFTLTGVLVLFFVSASTARAGVVASWSGNGNTTDSVAGRNGTLINGADYGTGVVGQAFQFDGVNDYVSVADNDVWTFGANPFTIALWANFDVIKKQSLDQLPNVFIGHDEGGGTAKKWIFFYDDDGNLAFHINGTGSVSLTSPTTFSPTTGTWHHYALTRSGSTYEFYADGTSLGTRTDSLSISNASAALTIGQAEGLGYIDGLLDEVQIYDNALSATQIQGLASVPEPSSLLLLTCAAAAWGVGGSLRRRGRKAA